jgi:hypothetical protein
MNKYFIVFFLLFYSLPVMGAEAITAKGQADLGSSRGKIRVEFVEQLAEQIEEKDSPRQGVMRVYLDSSLIQSIALDFWSRNDQELRFEFMDLNDDGYIDLLFYNSRTGTAGAAEDADVFVWTPTQNRFTQSKELSGEGKISKAEKMGCIDVSTKCTIAYWWTRTMCFNKKSEEWDVIADDQCAGPEVEADSVPTAPVDFPKKMTSCAMQAKEKMLNGREREGFMRACLSS